jgi:trimethyllysine dioxygenase
MSQLHPELKISGAGEPIKGCETGEDKTSVTVEFEDAIFTFHAQWLYDARYDDGPYRDATQAFCQQPPTARISATHLLHQGIETTLGIVWENGAMSEFPALWLRAVAPVVAKRQGGKSGPAPSFPPGWLAQNLTIPEVQYAEIFPEEAAAEELDSTFSRILDALLLDSEAGIIKVTGLPAPDADSERNGVNAIVTRVLKQIFGSVFKHPVRDEDTTFNAASHHEKDVRKGTHLFCYAN